LIWLKKLKKIGKKLEPFLSLFLSPTLFIAKLQQEPFTHSEHWEVSCSLLKKKENCKKMEKIREN